MYTCMYTCIKTVASQNEIQPPAGELEKAQWLWQAEKKSKENMKKMWKRKLTSTRYLFVSSNNVIEVKVNRKHNKSCHNTREDEEESQPDSKLHDENWGIRMKRESNALSKLGLFSFRLLGHLHTARCLMHFSVKLLVQLLYNFWSYCWCNFWCNSQKFHQKCVICKILCHKLHQMNSPYEYT